MADRPSNFSGHQADDPLSEESPRTRADRLESWKEIAAYLKRGLRTVQRWEKQEGLPVHRLQHDKASTVYAYMAELDAWWDEGRSRLEKESEEETEFEQEPTQPNLSIESGNGHAPIEAVSPRPSLHRRNRLFWILGATAAVVACAAAAIHFLRPRPSAVLHFHSRDMVLIASFDNRTGDPLFDGTIEAALGRELTNSQFVSVAPRVRINDTLALMRKPAKTRVDAALGREICLRDGGIRAMITGRIDKFGSTYLVSANLVDPASGRFVASFEEQANSQAAILPAVHRLSDRLRQALGEDLSQIRKSDLALQDVTTPSLKALQLYTKADRELQDNNQATAYELLRQAIADDSNFASAYIMAAWSLHNQGKPSAEYMAYARRALELSSKASESERYFIEGSYSEMAGQRDRAIAAYQALLQVDPDHFWGLHNLSTMSGAANPAIPGMYVRLAKFRPDDFNANWMAAFYTAIVAGKPNQAKPYLQRANAILRAGGGGLAQTLLYRDGVAWLRLYPSYQAWMKDDIPLALAEAKRVEPSLDEQDEDCGRHALGEFYLTLGQARTAHTWFGNVPGSNRFIYESGFIDLDFALGDHAALRNHLLVRPPLFGGFINITLMAREGLLGDAERGIQYHLKALGVHSYAEADPANKILIGELYLAQGRTSEGISVLRDALQHVGFAASLTLLGSEILAQAYEKQGKLQPALQVLETASAGRSGAEDPMVDGGTYWMRDQLDLAELDRRLGRVQDAEKIENELRKLLAYADPDFPLLVELERLQKAPTVVQKPN